MFETITPGGAAKVADHSQQPAAPDPKQQAPAANAGTVSLEDALKGANHAKMNVFSVSDMAKPGATANGVPNSSASVPPGQSVTLGGMVQGKLVVDLMDALLPAIIVLVFHRFGLSVKKSQMQLTQGEKNTLNPIVEACLNSINLDFSNPWSALSITLLLIYGGKAIEVGGTGWLDKKSSEGKPFEGPKEKASVVPMSIVGGQMANGSVPIIEKPNTNDTGFNPGDAGPPTWTDADVKAIVKRRKKGPQDAIEWLNKNWVKKGGKA